MIGFDYTNFTFFLIQTKKTVCLVKFRKLTFTIRGNRVTSMVSLS